MFDIKHSSKWYLVNNSKLIDKLSRSLNPLSFKQIADAVVCLILKTTPDLQDLEIFIVKRVKSETDPWSGQMALPGGKSDPKDLDLKQTVIREVFEETNIDLSDKGQFIGTLRVARSIVKPEMKILPFVVHFDHEPNIKLNQELDKFFWFPMHEFSKNRRVVSFDFGKFPAFVVKNHVIWGLTYRILEDFNEIIRRLCKR